MTLFRDERTELVFLLESLKGQRCSSHKPEMFDSAIRQTRRKLLGLYRQTLNTRKPVDTIPEAGQPTIELKVEQTFDKGGSDESIKRTEEVV